MRPKLIYNMNPRRINELIDEVLAEIEAEGGMEDAIRKEKACKIDDIMRGAKMAQIYDPRFRAELADPAGFFDKLYELDLDALDAYSKALDNRNTAYMANQVRLNNMGSGFWDLYDNNFM